ncbi:frataxin-like domain-containing protein [Cryptosporidium muris RN66]|uniref:Frataxin-like domain-containing protein n=1 Tax=Cryptosporidium muris (strain RN66) TaxID=441375 RepID=B6A922_CRYMR|nr:frataxin-like domain-containing protein [Cryptosporidium muris RN66]EEA04713.1 frataxin-like domain-containing protein [Cryptosporidium muris RN66]|eukprot:XP_002139062.1 frataxin-like domain-containing protein [Cryptosporidium muris RN66]
MKCIAIFNIQTIGSLFKKSQILSKKIPFKYFCNNDLISIRKFSIINKYPKYFTTTSIADFNNKADQLLHIISEKIINTQDQNLIDDIDCHNEFLNITFRYKDRQSSGTIVISKQSATKQIWYSSPIRPPDYFEFESNWKSKRSGLSLFEALESDLFEGTGLKFNFLEK